MEYSLYNLNTNLNLNYLTFNEIINKLNLIGFEVDEIFKEVSNINSNLEEIRLLIKIPSNRDDLLTEKFFLIEFKNLFILNFNLNSTKIKKMYFFLLKQTYLKYFKYQTILIEAPVSNFCAYTIEVRNCSYLKTPCWIEKKLIKSAFSFQNSLNDLFTLMALEWGQSVNSILLSDKKIKDTVNYYPFRFECLNEKSVFISKTDQNALSLLEPGTLVLKSHEDEILSVFGIINLLPSKFFKKNFLIEAIFYDIEQNELNLSTINTKISLRFLRKTFFTNFKYAFQRLLTLIELITHSSICLHKFKTKSNLITLDSNRIILLKKETLKNVLNLKQIETRFFKLANLKVICQTKTKIYFIVPNYRKDLLREIDLVEEYSRFLGYKNFPEIFPSKKSSFLKKKPIKLIKSFFLNYGFHELSTLSLIELKNEKKAVKIKNPINGSLSILRSDFLFQIFNFFENNLKFGFFNKNLFEIGRVFKKNNSKIIEQEKLGGIFILPLTKTSNKSYLEWFIAKGFLENFLTHFGYENCDIEALEYLLTDKYLERASLFHPTRSIYIKHKKKIIGKFGQINPIFTLKLGKKLKEEIPYIFEFNLHHFKRWQISNQVNLYKEYSKYPSTIRDLSFSINKKQNLDFLKKQTKANSFELINVDFFDLYYNPQKPKELRIGLRLEFQSNRETLLNEVVEKELTKIKYLLINTFNANFN
jgi:phenylalanyl-tRNA synthetase beta chain